MITWMQKHKKYLILTIWISTIAFIAAGMVGWGAYGFSSGANALAKVGDIAINAEDFNREYSYIFTQQSEQYRALMGRELDNDEAKKLGLDNVALKRLIDKALLLQFAADVGLRVGEAEVASEIQKIETFHKNGRFDAGLYREILGQNRLKPADFEANVKKDLLLQKILAAFPSIVTPLEGEILNLPSSLEDHLAIQIINEREIPVNLDEREVLSYYEKHKENYKTKKEYRLEIITTPLNGVNPSDEEAQKYYDENRAQYAEFSDFAAAKGAVAADLQKREAQKAALRAYVDFRDAKISGESRVVAQDSLKSEIARAIEGTKNGEILKPMLDENAFLTIKLVEKIPQKIREFSEVKDAVKADYYGIAKLEAMKNYAQNRINIFNGKSIGFFSLADALNSQKQVAGLNDAEKQQFLAGVFQSQKRADFVLLGDKVVLWRILEQKLLPTTNNVSGNLFNSAKSSFLERTVIEFLAKRYKIVNNFKKDS